MGSTVECKQVVQLGTAGLQGVHSTLNGVGGEGGNSVREVDCYRAGPEVTRAEGSLLHLHHHHHHHHHHLNPLLCLRPLHNVLLRNAPSLLGGFLPGVKRLGLEAD